MAFWNRKSDPVIPVDTTSYKAWKADDGGGVRWHAALKNEAAEARSWKKSYSIEPASKGEVRAAKAAGDRWVAEEAEGLYNGRGHRGRRSVQFDGHGRGRVPLFSIQGIWGARQDPERWPSRSIPREPWPGGPRGGGGGGRAGRDGCPGCSQC